ncbi:MAG: hypothetical protein R2744_02040 [Bacteroidales bacterium]
MQYQVPYEVNRVRLTGCLPESIDLLETAFEGKRRIELAIRDITERLREIEKVPGQRPLLVYSAISS